ncbi:PE family protein [Mycobacterium vicinigordonae]|uniref:PE family protein n=1 Tax=Mycobacterium vicinigordonae TaxID=1719132 RepID=UPI001FE9B3F4|nr:PE family protein [Mycobacterium vicinigordonae]
MSRFSAVPGAIGAAAANVAGIGTTISAANALAAAPTTAVLAAAGDQVSAAVATFFCSHAQTYQTISAQAASFHAQFARAIDASANAYASTDSANATSLGNSGSAGSGSAYEYVAPPRPVGAWLRPSTPAVAPARADRPAAAGVPAEAGPVVASGACGGLLLGSNQAGTAGSGRAGGAAAGGSGGLLSRLLQGDERRAKSPEVGRVSAGTGVGVLLAPPNAQGALRPTDTACSKRDPARLGSPT